MKNTVFHGETHNITQVFKRIKTIVKNRSLNSDVYRGKVSTHILRNKSIETQKWISDTLKSPKWFTCQAFG